MADNLQSITFLEIVTLFLLALSLHQGTTNHNDEEQEWMHDMEREFIDWQRTHCCADCLEGIEDPTKLVDHFYETKPDPLDTKRNPVCSN